MKKLILFSVIILISASVQAQKREVEFGLKGGLNYSSFRTPDAANDVYKAKFGFYLGGFATFEITEKFKVQPELQFAVQGARFVLRDIQIIEGSGEPPKIGDFKTRINESTIVLPFMGQYYINEVFYLEAGPQFGFIINTNEKVTESPTDDPNFNSTSNSNRDVFDVGLAIGAGYMLTDNLGLNARYYYGLVKRDSFIYSSVLNIGLEYNL